MMLIEQLLYLVGQAEEEEKLFKAKSIIRKMMIIIITEKI